MKRNIFGLAAVVLAVAFSAFSTKQIQYFVTAENSTQYTITTVDPTDNCTDGDKLCKFVYTGSGSLSSPLSISAYNNLRSLDQVQEESFQRP